MRAHPISRSAPTRLFPIWLAAALALVCPACSVTTHLIQPPSLGKPSSLAAMEAVMDRPGPIAVDSIASADWAVPLSGLLNLDAPAARQAGLKDREEAIEIYAHVLRHPSRGAYLVDTGVSRLLLADPGRYGVNALMRHFMPVDRIIIRESTGEIVGRLGEPLQGVFFTHLHIDHISGLPDIAATVPLYVGRYEATATSFENLFVRGATDGLLEGKAALRQWDFEGTADQPLASVIDVFGDGTLFAVNVPGHTPGSTAYVARTPQGPVLLVGDTCHTRWGWNHDVEPGSYTADRVLNRSSLLALKALSQRHPGLQIRLGHQAPASGE
jgi:N-acyl homoserine lactone hydrolase